MMLDLESVRLFTLVATYGNFTRAAEASGTVQPVVSQRIKTLEQVLGHRLLDRSPRLVRLTAAGTLFLDRAQALLAAHDAALSLSDMRPTSVRLGISDHTLGTAFDHVFRRLREALPSHASITVHLGQSAEVRGRFEAGSVDLAIVRRESGAEDGEILGSDPLDWRGMVPQRAPGEPVPLVVLPAPCAVRAVAIRALEDQDTPWRESFVGGSCMALAAAVRAGLGVAPLGRLVGGDLPLTGPRSGLPPLPSSQIVFLARTGDAIVAAAARTLAASVRELLGAPVQAGTAGSRPGGVHRRRPRAASAASP